MSTVPLLNSQLRSQDLTKTRKSSEFGKRMILPVVPEASIINTKAKKKTKFTPPLLSGGYAERFLNLMTYHKSEYTMWANATLRKVKLFGSTEPLAIMEIVSISSEGSLQWARCNVILCENEKSPFYVISKEDEYYCIGSPNLSQILQTDMNENSENLAIEESDIVRSTPSQDISLWNSQEDAIMEEDDSIYGLHKDISKMGVLISSQGSGLDNTNGPKNQHYQPSHCNNILGVASEGETRASSGIQYLKSSQGSDDEVEEPEFRIGRSKEVKRSKLNIRDVSRTVTLPCIGEPPQTENILPADEVNYNDAATSQWNVEALEKSNASSTNNTLPSSKIMGKAVESAILRDSIEPDSGIWILFSNLFNWSRLKVADRVEIHDPCRKILVPNPRSNDPHTAMWIVERYVVVPPDKLCGCLEEGTVLVIGRLYKRHINRLLKDKGWNVHFYHGETDTCISQQERAVVVSTDSDFLIREVEHAKKKAGIYESERSVEPIVCPEAETSKQNVVWIRLGESIKHHLKSVSQVQGVLRQFYSSNMYMYSTRSTNVGKRSCGR
ncbi:hypothetical protein BGZ76_006203 [Entomortierella beljakovae]|nr:hypothetical protein BGZ76_006203 [Entomortierella beljakovae]